MSSGGVSIWLAGNLKVINAPLLALELILLFFYFFFGWARESEVAERMSCHNAKQTGSASRRCCLSLKGARLKGFRRNLFDVCYVFSNMFRSFSYPPVLVGWRHSVPANCSSNECWKIFHRKFLKFSQADFFLCDCGGCYKKWASHGVWTFVFVCWWLSNNKLRPKKA